MSDRPIGTPGRDVTAYLGMPFARADRFSSPVAVHALPKEARHPGPAPVQVIPYYEEPGAPLSEDCLNLNVWAPTNPHAEQLPVIVWVYGGGFEHGSNASATNDASRLAATGRVVTVSINYRLGVLGFLSLAHFGNELAEATNLGLQDVIAALRWVRTNISTFGGDPRRVTVLGESAGAFLTGALPASPAADGLFHQLAMFSGGASRIVPQDRARTMSAIYLEATGLAEDPTEILQRAASDLVAAQSLIAVTDIGLRNNTSPQALGVVNDSEVPGGVLSEHPLDCYQRGGARGIPMLLSSLTDEIAAFRNPEVFDPPDVETLSAELTGWGIPAPDTTRIVDAYASGGTTPGLARERLLTDWIYRLPAARAVIAQADAGGIAYLLSIGRVDGQPAGHACDAAAQLGIHREGATSEEALREDAITRAVLEFATTGTPGWEQVSANATDPYCMTIGEHRGDVDGYAHALNVWAGVRRP